MLEENTDPNWIGSGTEEEEIYRENILDHYKQPHNFGILEAFSFKQREVNPLCGDAIELAVNIKENKVHDVKFTGKGCAISIATSSMLTDHIKGKTVEEIKQINEDKIAAMLGIKLGIVRMKCGLLCLKTLAKGILQQEQNNE